MKAVGINSDFKVAEETLKEILTKIKKLETEEELIQSACIDYDNSNFGQNKINYELELGKFARTLKITEFKNDNSLDPGVRTTDSIAPPQIFDSSAKENKYIIDLYRQVKITEAINNMKNNVDVVRDSTGVIITDDTARKIKQSYSLFTVPEDSLFLYTCGYDAVENVPDDFIQAALQMIKVWYYESEKQINEQMIPVSVKAVLDTYRRFI
jgi:hypothetical protein